MIYDMVLRNCTFPKIWKEANVTPIYKKGNRQDNKNYRPVSLLSTARKYMESVIFNELYSYCEEMGILTWRNSGYRQKDSITNQLLYLVNNIHRNLDNKE
jgi:hypothetical protein